MAEFILKEITIAGIACAVPDREIKTEQYYKQFGNKIVDDFISTTGVRATRCGNEKQTSSDLCFVAAQHLIKEKNVDRATIGALVFISQTPDYRLPATAAVLHKRLGLEKNCMAFDVNLGCSGFVYGLNIIGSLMKTSQIENALLLFGDTCRRTGSPQDHSIMLFGDAGSATLLTRGCDEIVGELMTDGSRFKSIIMPYCEYRNPSRNMERRDWGDGILRNDFESYTNGVDVFSFAISEVPAIVKSFLGRRNAKIDDYDALVLHQANMMIIKQIARKTKFPMEKVPISMDRYGNTSGASIPMTLCDAYGKTENSRLRVLISGFGIGLSWGIAELNLDAANVFPIISTSDYYTEGGLSLD